MSITRTRNFIEKSGCGYIVGIVLAVVLAFGILSTQCDQNAAQQQQRQEIVLATVGSQTVTASEVFAAWEASKDQMSQEVTTPGLDLFHLANAFNQQVRFAYYGEVAKQLGVEVTDEDVIQGITNQIEGSREQAKMMLLQQDKLKPNATEAEFEAAFKSQAGKDWATYRKEEIDKVRLALADPARRPLLVDNYLLEAVAKKLAEQLSITEEDVRASYDTFTVKKIFIPKNPAAGDAMAIARKALDEIKAGMSFEKAIDKYSKETPEPKKKLSDSTTTLVRQSVITDPSLEAVLKLKEGEVSEPIESPAAVTIYKVVKLKRDLPPDFEQKLAEYTRNYSTFRSSKEAFDRVEALQKELKVTYLSPGFEILNRFIELREDPKLSEGSPERKAALEKLAEDAKAVVDPAPMGETAAKLVRYWAMDQLWAKASPAEREKMLDARIEVLATGLEATENLSLRLDIVDLYLDAKRPDEAFNSLLLAAQNNTSFGPENAAAHKRTQDALNRLEKTKQIGDDQLADIREEIARWQREKKEEDKRLAEEKKRAEQAAKEAAEAEKRLKADEAKARDNKPPSDSKDFLGGSKEPGKKGK